MTGEFLWLPFIQTLPQSNQERRLCPATAMRFSSAPQSASTSNSSKCTMLIQLEKETALKVVGVTISQPSTDQTAIYHHRHWYRAKNSEVRHGPGLCLAFAAFPDCSSLGEICTRESVSASYSLSFVAPELQTTLSRITPVGGQVSVGIAPDTIFVGRR